MAKLYRAAISGQLINTLFINGEFKVNSYRVSQGIPDGASLVAVRLVNGSPGVLDLLYLSDEKGEIPEAVDMWEFAKRVEPVIQELKSE